MIAKDFACVLALGLLAVSSASAQTALAWKFAPGQVYEAERVSTQKQAVELKGKLYKQERRSTWHIRLAVQQRNLEGWRILAELTRVEQQLLGVSLDEKLDPKLAEKMQGSSFTLHVTPHGQIATFRGYEDFLKKLAGHDRARLQALRITFAEEAVKQIFADLFGPLPEKKVSPGDKWERVATEPIPHFGALRCTAHYVFEGQANQHERINYTLQTRYELPKGELLLFRIVKGNIQGDKGHGSLLFDAKAGCLVAHERSLRLQGTLIIDALNRQQPLEFRSENELKIRMKKSK